MPHHPIQHLLLTAATSRLYAATANVLHAFDAATGALLATRCIAADSSTAPANDPAKDDAAGPASKKRKVEEKSQKKTPKPVAAGPVVKMLTSNDGRYLLTATAEDKTVRVFSTAGAAGTGPAGSGLDEISTRTMPKRIVDLALTEHDNVILCADKFGDVYALPLIDTAPPPLSAKEEQAQAQVQDAAAAEARRKRTEIDHALPFTHKLLLGHVSMLLSLAAITMPPPPTDAGGKERTYILTADRDEHIRVSRYPQSYVIHCFCLGHTNFVNALLLPSWAPHTLLSAGGDISLMLWDWRQGLLLQEIDLAGPLQSVVGDSAPAPAPQGSTADTSSTTAEPAENTSVSTTATPQAEKKDAEPKYPVIGLWELPLLRGALVAVESVPALFLFTETAPTSTTSTSSSTATSTAAAGTWAYTSTLRLPGNVLDAAVDAADNSVWVSLDVQQEDEEGAAAQMVRRYALDTAGAWVPRPDAVLQGVDAGAGLGVQISEEELEKVRKELCYPVRNLYKMKIGTGGGDGGSDGE